MATEQEIMLKFYERKMIKAKTNNDHILESICEAGIEKYKGDE